MKGHSGSIQLGCPSQVSEGKRTMEIGFSIIIREKTKVSSPQGIPHYIGGCVGKGDTHSQKTRLETHPWDAETHLLLPALFFPLFNCANATPPNPKCT